MLISHQPRANRQGMGIAVRGVVPLFYSRACAREHEGLGRTAALLVREKLGNYGTHKVSQLLSGILIANSTGGLQSAI